MCSATLEHPKKCGGCKIISYCDKICQTLHWKTHKSSCKTSTENNDSPSVVNVKINVNTSCGAENDEFINDVDVAMDALLGRVLISKRKILKGEVIFRERPLLVWDETNVSSCFESFLNSVELTQEHILDMYHPPLDGLENTRVNNQRDIAQNISAILNYSDIQKIHKVLMIRDTNAHAYFGEIQESTTYIKSENDAPPSKFALYNLGSKVAHSCAPNCMYSSKWGGKCSTFVANVDLNPGDILTFSYINCFESPTHIRRAKLKDEKAFHCDCRRCLGPDYSRGIRCSEVTKHSSRNKLGGKKSKNEKKYHCQGFLLNSNQSNEWICNKCETIFSHPFIAIWIKNKEEELSAKLDAFKTSSGVNSMAFNALDEFAKEMLQFLSRVHYLMMEFWGFYNTIAATMCHYMEVLLEKQCKHIKGKDDVNKNTEKLLHNRDMMQRTISSGMELLKCIECVAADCVGDCLLKGCHHEHDPVNDTAHYVVWIFKDLCKFDPTQAKLFASRYVSVLHSNYGPDDPDVKLMMSL